MNYKEVNEQLSFVQREIIRLKQVVQQGKKQQYTNDEINLLKQHIKLTVDNVLFTTSE